MRIALPAVGAFADNTAAADCTCCNHIWDYKIRCERISTR